MMRDEVKEGDEMPKSMAELQDRIKKGKGRKKDMWVGISNSLGRAFGENFEWERVCRKWNTLVAGYKEAKQRRSLSGHSPSRFEFYEEMNSLTGHKHDVSFPVTATSSGITVHRPEVIGNNSSMDSVMESAPVAGNSSLGTATTPSRKRKRASRVDDPILQYLKESDEAAKATQQQILETIQKSQESFEKMFMALLEKK